MKSIPLERISYPLVYIQREQRSIQMRKWRLWLERTVPNAHLFCSCPKGLLMPSVNLYLFFTIKSFGLFNASNVRSNHFTAAPPILVWVVGWMMDQVSAKSLGSDEVFLPTVTGSGPTTVRHFSPLAWKVSPWWRGGPLLAHSRSLKVNPLRGSRFIKNTFHIGWQEINRYDMWGWILFDLKIIH